MNAGKVLGVSRREVMTARALQRHPSQRCLIFGVLIVLGGSAVMAGIIAGYPGTSCSESGGLEKRSLLGKHDTQFWKSGGTDVMEPVDCWIAPQKAPLFAHQVEGMRYPFFISINDLGTAEKPVKNFQRMIKGKFFQKPAISQIVQDLLEKLSPNSSIAQRKEALVVDVGANIGMASFAASAMGFRVLAFEPVFENLQRLCDGLYLNRVGQLVKLYQAAVSDQVGNITLHQVIGRLDNSAVSAAGATLSFRSNEVAPVVVETVTLDSVIPDDEPVLLLKVDVQGWEYHVLQGAVRLLTRPPETAAYVIYEDDEQLLQASSASSEQILDFMTTCGYSNCIKVGGDRHCTKKT